MTDLADDPLGGGGGTARSTDPLAYPDPTQVVGSGGGGAQTQTEVKTTTASPLKQHRKHSTDSVGSHHSEKSHQSHASQASTVSGKKKRPVGGVKLAIDPRALLPSAGRTVGAIKKQTQRGEELIGGREDETSHTKEKENIKDSNENESQIMEKEKEKAKVKEESETIKKTAQRLENDDEDRIGLFKMCWDVCCVFCLEGLYVLCMGGFIVVRTEPK